MEAQSDNRRLTAILFLTTAFCSRGALGTDATSAGEVITSTISSPYLTLEPDDLTFFGIAQPIVVCRAFDTSTLHTLKWDFLCDGTCLARPPDVPLKTSYSAIRLIASDWNYDGHLTCYSDEQRSLRVRRNVLILGLPSIEPNETVFRVGDVVNVTCALENVNLTADLSWHYDCGGRCLGNSRIRGGPNHVAPVLLVVMSESWDGVTIVCNSSKYPAATSSRVVLVDRPPSINISFGHAQDLVINSAVTATCQATGVRLGGGLTWDVQGCQTCPYDEGPTMAAASGTSLSSTLSFVAESAWNGTKLICYLTADRTMGEGSATIWLRDTPPEPAAAETTGHEEVPTHVVTRTISVLHPVESVSSGLDPGERTTPGFTRTASSAPSTPVPRVDMSFGSATTVGPKTHVNLSATFSLASSAFTKQSTRSATSPGQAVAGTSFATVTDSKISSPALPQQAATVSSPAWLAPVIQQLQATYFENQEYALACSASDSTPADMLIWDVSCARDGRACQYASQLATQDGKPVQRLVFTAVRASWNGTTVRCKSLASGLQSPSETITTQPLPPIVTSPSVLNVYVGVTATATCNSNEVWSADKLSWSVKTCPTGKCDIKADGGASGGTRSVSFVVTADWNGAVLSCSAREPYAQEGTTSVNAKPFPTLVISPATTSFDETSNVTLLCTASEYFDGDSLLWTMQCLSGLCPQVRQGTAMKLTSSGTTSARFLSFIATAEWDNATVSCAVAQYAFSRKSRVITITMAQATQHPSTASEDNLGVIIGLSAGAVALVILAAAAICVCRHPRTSAKTAPSLPRTPPPPTAAEKVAATPKRDKIDDGDDHRRPPTIAESDGVSGGSRAERESLKERSKPKGGDATPGAADTGAPPSEAAPMSGAEAAASDAAATSDAAPTTAAPEATVPESTVGPDRDESKKNTEAAQSAAGSDLESNRTD